MNVQEMHLSMQKFGWADYVVFVLMLAGCSLVGVFFAFRGRNSTDAAAEYLMGGRQMSIFPVAMSLVAT